MYPGQHQPQKPNPGLTFLGMSGGILALVIAAVIILPVLCCVGMMFFGVIGAATTDPTPIPTYTYNPPSYTP